MATSETNDAAAQQERLRRSARIRGRVTLLLAFLILVPSLWGFGSKFIEFVKIYRGEVDGAFAIAPILNYLLASAGFFLLLCWAALNGMFHDIEAPKQTMLENEKRLDEASRRDWAARARRQPPPA